QVVKVGFCEVASDANRPATVTPSVSGASADTENAPSQPYGASGIVYRTCGMRVTPALPLGPPKLMFSLSPSGSEKFELAWPASIPPRLAYAKRRRGTKLSVDNSALLPGENWLPLAQSNSMK